MTNDFEALSNALVHRGAAEVFRLVAAGADVNARDADGQPFLSHVIFIEAPYDGEPDPAPWLDLIATLIDMGADPSLLDADGGSILIGPIFSQSEEMLELLLSRGVDPNRGCSETWETVYDLADFDYHYEVGLTCQEVPAVTMPEQANDEDGWVQQLDIQARERGLLRPALLLVLRRYGALSNREMARKLGGDGSEQIVWLDDRWQMKGSIRPDTKG